MDAAPTLRARKKARTRRTLSETALDLFERKGFDATTVDDIAERAEISRSTFFRYFPTKESVLFPHSAKRLSRFRAALRSAGAGSAAFETVRRALLEMAELYVANREELVAQHRVVESSASLIAYERELDLQWEAAIANALEREDGAEAAHRRRARVLAGAVMGAIRATLREWFVTGGEGDLVAMGTEALDMLERGVL